MSISKKILKEWKEEALQQIFLSEREADSVTAKLRKEAGERILCLTKELLGISAHFSI